MGTKALFAAVITLLLTAGSAFAQMSEGGMNAGLMSGEHIGAGMDFGMRKGGGRTFETGRNATANESLGNLSPITAPEKSRKAVPNFTDLSNSNPQTSEVREYGTAHGGGPEDANGLQGFNLLGGKMGFDEAEGMVR